MNHNRSATKQYLHPQSVAEISRHSVLSGDRRIWECGTYIVWVSPQGHRSVSVSRHLLLQAPQCPCSVQKRFSKDHCCRGRSKPGCRIVGSHIRWELTTWADFQLCLHRILMSIDCKFSHNGFLDVSRSNGGLSISGCIGQLSCLTIFSTSLSVAAFLRRAGDSMLESTGSHGRGVERRVPEMRRYRLATKLNSTQSTMLKVDCCRNRQQIGNKVNCCRTRSTLLPIHSTLLPMCTRPKWHSNSRPCWIQLCRSMYRAYVELNHSGWEFMP